MFETEGRCKRGSTQLCMSAGTLELLANNNVMVGMYAIPLLSGYAHATNPWKTEKLHLLCVCSLYFHLAPNVEIAWRRLAEASHAIVAKSSGQRSSSPLIPEEGGILLLPEDGDILLPEENNIFWEGFHDGGDEVGTIPLPKNKMRN